ncbi:MAG: lipoprotein [Alcanivoracaceae bacterium]|nr:lipoprotein [Alcanivoracaceae bacterium]
MKTNILRITIVAVLCLTLYACGNKGDLYLPEKNKDKTEQQS